MKQPLSDQEIGEIIEAIAHQHASYSNIGSIKKRFLIGFVFLFLFVLSTVLIMNQVSKVTFQKKPSYALHEAISFENASEISLPTSSSPISNPTSFQIPTIQSSSHPTPQILPLPIPDEQIEIRPLIPPTPLPYPILEEDKLFSDKEKEPKSTVTTVQEKEENIKEESSSIVEIKLSENSENS